MNKQQARELDKAIAVLKAAGYRVVKPRTKTIVAPRLNAVGKPYGANYDSNYKMRHKPTSIKRLYAPYGQGMQFVPHFTIEEQ
ncbi:MAG TPA: hypothetical protein VKE42_02090, partial [Candidatus Cybelea sp.]|nr:hypothetical protein [Candidatus Cybelea sp.]